MLRHYGNKSSETLGVIDIGSSKICCAIAERSAAGDGPHARILGVGHGRSRGVKGGFLVDLDQAEAAVRAAVSQAEQMAGITLDRVVVNVTCGRVRSMHYFAHANLASGQVGRDDIQRLSGGAYVYAERGGRAVVHMSRIGYQLDGVPVRTPLRLSGRRLSAQYHAVSVDEAPLDNLNHLIERCYLEVDQFVPSGFASAVAAASDDERRFGVIVADIGEGAISLALMAESRFLFSEVLPFGGGHVTYDVARVLGTSLDEAERIKTLYGTMIVAGSDERQIISFQRVRGDEGEPGQLTRAELRQIIYPRVHSQLKLLRERIRSSSLLSATDYGVVVTGGGSQLTGLPQVASEVLGRPVRLGGARALQGLPEAMTSPTFATVVGMVECAAKQTAQDMRGAPAAGRHRAQGSYLERMRSWLQESF